MRRLLIAFVVCVVLVIGVVAAVVIHRLQGEGNIRGSSTEEFVTTTAAPKPPPLGTPWPQYGFDETRDRSVQLSLGAIVFCQRIFPNPAANAITLPSPCVGFALHGGLFRKTA
jgi:hypothetical protein